MNVSCRTVLTLLALAAGVSASAGNLSFLDKSPASKFTPQDVQLLQATALELLTSGGKGASRDWSNPETRASGKLTILNAFTSTEGFRCRTLRVENSAGGYSNRASHRVCEIKPGDWQIHSAAKPAPDSVPAPKAIP